MKEYEIAIKSWNGCGGQSNATTRFEEVEIESPEEYLRAKHGVDFPKFSKEVTSTGQIVHLFDNGAIGYSYKFTEI